jgi:hypothetical protein
MRWLTILAILVGGCLMGCTGTATTALSAGDALDRLADQMGTAIDEYHEEVAAGDDSRESEVSAAFVSRVIKNANNAGELKNDQAQFLAALSKIRSDRETEWDRRNAAKDNVAALREVSKGLRRVALDSLSLNDEMRRYLTGWYDTYQKSKAEQDAKKAAQRQANTDKRNELIKTGVGIAAPQYSPIVNQVLDGGAK